MTSESSQETPEERPAIISEQPVQLQRSVRYGRIIITGIALGIIVGLIAAVARPVDPEAQYTLAQVAGFSAIIGGGVGLALSSLLALVLGLVAKRSRGSGVAIQTDVR